MAVEFNHNITPADYATALRRELETATEKAHKAAILTELEQVESRNAVAPRGDVTVREGRHAAEPPTE